MKAYDIFISYRRSSYDTANLIATRLKAAGYSVFFDMETLRTGKFNEQLYEAIDKCKDFVLILPPDALDRCVNEDDWVRLEVCRAMSGNKNIIPIMLNGFVWPTPMPQGMEELNVYHALTASSVEYFDLSMERLQSKYLISKPHLPIARLLKTASIVVLSLLAIIAILWGVFIVMSQDVCKKYVALLTKDAGNVHFITTENHYLSKDWNEFVQSIHKTDNFDELTFLCESMLDRIELAEKNVKEMWSSDSSSLVIGEYHSFLLSIHGIVAEEIALSPLLAKSYYNEFVNHLNFMRQTVNEPNEYNIRYVAAYFEAYVHSSNLLYASILAELSNFPKTSRGTFDTSSKEWIYYPKHYAIDNEEKYYEDIIITESKLAEEILSSYQSFLEKKDAEIEDIKLKSEKLEQKMNEAFDELNAKGDSIMSYIEAARNVTKIKQDNKKEIAIRSEKIKAKEVAVSASRAELEELDKQYIQSYESLKKKCTIEEGDDQWYKWGKIRRFSTFLSMIVNSRKELKSQGIYSTSSITPEIVYADMNSLLTVYHTYHPESKEYVAPAKAFYREVSMGKRPYAGVLVFSFKYNELHPQLKVGDIIVEYEGAPVSTYESLKVLASENKEGALKLLRLENGELKEMKFDRLQRNDIVGFLDLIEKL